jgi:hypothetical protein
VEVTVAEIAAAEMWAALGGRLASWQAWKGASGGKGGKCCREDIAAVAVAVAEEEEEVALVVAAVVMRVLVRRVCFHYLEFPDGFSLLLVPGKFAILVTDQKSEHTYTHNTQRKTFD